MNAAREYKSLKGGAYSRFEQAIKSEETKRKYVSRLEKFLDFCKFKGGTLKEKPDGIA